MIIKWRGRLNPHRPHAPYVVNNVTITVYDNNNKPIGTLKRLFVMAGNANIDHVFEKVNMEINAGIGQKIIEVINLQKRAQAIEMDIEVELNKRIRSAPANQCTTRYYDNSREEEEDRERASRAFEQMTNTGPRTLMPPVLADALEEIDPDDDEDDDDHDDDDHDDDAPHDEVDDNF